MCRLTGQWIVVGREGDSYELRSDDRRTVRTLSVRHRPDADYLMFQAALPLRFPLDRTPSGLFARMLLRNVGLKYSHWNLDLRGSFEASAYLSAQWPKPGMTPGFFASLCREMVDEAAGLHQELRDSFRGERSAAARPVGAVPDSDGIHFLGPVRNRPSLLNRPASLTAPEPTF